MVREKSKTIYVVDNNKKKYFDEKTEKIISELKYIINANNLNL